jgi:hypothetical protein
MYRRRGFLLACALALAGCSHQPAPATSAKPGPDGISVVRAPGGVHVVINHHPVHVTLDLAGTEVGVSEDDPGVWLVDGQIIQVAVVPRQAIYGGSSTRVTDQQLLLDHMAWEASYVSAELGTPVEAHQQACRTARGAECLFSDYDVAPRRNLLITTVIADQVVGLGSSVPAGHDSGEAVARLRAVLDSVTPREGWIDPAVEAQRLHAEP